MGRRTARWYSWAVGSLGIGFLVATLAVERQAVLRLLHGEFLALLAMFAVLEVNRMPARGGAYVGFSFIAVVAALLLWGATLALAVNLGALVPWLLRRKAPRLAVFNTGVFVLATAAGSAAALYLEHDMRYPSAEIKVAGLAVFVAVYSLVDSVLVGIYSRMDARRGRSMDHAYSLSLYLVHLVVSASVGMSMAMAYKTLGVTSLYFLCVTLSVMAVLIARGSRAAVNQEGPFGLYQAASSINEALTLRDVFERARAFVGSLLETDFAWLSLPAGESDEQLTVAYTWVKDGVDPERSASQVMSLSKEEREQFAKGRFSWSRDSERPGEGYFGWAAAMPLRLAKQFLGEFGVASLAVPVEVSADKLQLFAVLSSHLALAVDNALKFERATMLAFTDPLTGLYNYRQFQNLFHEAIARAERTGSPVSLIYIDLDYFRDVNNAYGHQVGDEALKGIGDVIRASCRDNDMICRPGGDEFTVILPGVAREDARMVAGRIRESLAAASLEVGLSEPLVAAVGASVGVSTYPEDGQDVDALVRRADMDMYASKSESGRGAIHPP